MMRDRATLRFALLIPLFQIGIFGLIDTEVRDVPTVVFDQSRSQESRELIDELVNTSYFEVARQVASRNELRREIIAGRASVGIEIPPDFARRRLARQTAEFLVLIDGSEASIASQTLAAANGLALRDSLRELKERSARRSDSALDPRPVVLFNPDSRSANLLIPGLVAIILTFSGSLLSALAIVREKEAGTFEQLMVTPVSPLAIVIGKLLPYLALGIAQLALVLWMMTFVFRVPIHGSLALLLAVSVVYLTALLSLGLVISARARTQTEATQVAQMLLLPSILLSGYIFPLSSLPLPVRWLSELLPATHFVELSRAVIIRGATFADVWIHVAALVALSAALLLVGARAFSKTAR